MGSCISKCTSNKNSNKENQEDQVDHQQQLSNEVQDKVMVISQITPKTPKKIFPTVNPNKFISPSKTPPYASPSHSTSSSSVSSFITCTTSKTSVSSSSSSMCSSASSAISSKDKSSFSNEFLRSCYKENPHIARINSLKKTHCAPHNKPPTCPQKRVRSNSPINSSASLTRQKSFRIDQCPRDYQNFSALRSPSPSRRFGNYQNGDKLLEYHSKRLSSSSSSMGSNYNSASFSRRENLRPSSPIYINSSRSGLRSTREQRNIHRVGSKIDEIAVAEALARNEIDNLLLVDDIDNPLISLDCFIFI